MRAGQRVLDVMQDYITKLTVPERLALVEMIRKTLPNA